MTSHLFALDQAQADEVCILCFTLSDQVGFSILSCVAKRAFFVGVVENQATIWGVAPWSWL